MVTPTRLLRASWSHTLRLPISSFPARPLPAENAKYLARCTDELYEWQQRSRSRPDAQGNVPETFTLHDGPPYANGPLHIGHALNKITKDIICRHELGQGKKVNYIPGWDCHGLPIEIKALQARKQETDADTDPVSVRKAARELAARTVEEQMKGFKEWAVMGDWDNPYKTMDSGFEIRQLEVFKKMFDKGLIYRQFKPVYWSPSSRTALAEAELEYDENHKSTAAFVRFPVTVSENLKNGALSDISGPLGVVIWTTTPWTLPANKAIAVHNDMEYVIVRDPENGNELTLIAASRVTHYEEMLGHKLEVLPQRLRGSDLVGNLQYMNPFQEADGYRPVLHADYVTDSSGTGLVHTAPGHGMEDYHTCSNLDSTLPACPAFAPVDDAGKFTEEAFPAQPHLLKGLPVADAKVTGTRAVLKYLGEQGILRAKHSYRHKYPIDWRTKEPVIVRATAQWFANVDGIKDLAMKALEGVHFLPETGRSRLESFIQGRSQWCISRQRAWGVPIPALYKVTNGELEAAMDTETIQHVINVIKERGIDAWWTDAQDDPAWKPKHLQGTYVRGKDTMDVWFDSGTSWTLLPEQETKPVADVYLEGTDQHRGWFQSSLLTHVAAQNRGMADVQAPYKTLITHGFTLDSKGRKMSKSLGNVVSPAQIISGELAGTQKKKRKGRNGEESQNDGLGSDALRLWAASSDYTKDVSIGQAQLFSVEQALRKYRVTLKWLLGILSLPTCPPPFSSLNTVRAELQESSSKLSLLADTIALRRLFEVSEEVHGHYAKYEFYKGVKVINNFLAKDLSAFYFETLKDRVYTGPKADCQTLQHVLGVIYYELLHMLAPVCPLLVEEAWDHLPDTLKENSVHPMRNTWQPLRPVGPKSVVAKDDPHSKMILSDWDEYIHKIGQAVNTATERLRANGHIGSSLEARVIVEVVDCQDPWGLEKFLADTSFGQDHRFNELTGLFVVSEFEVRDHAWFGIAKAEMHMKEKPFEYQEVKWGEGEDIQNYAHARIMVTKSDLAKCPRCWRLVVEKPVSDKVVQAEEERLCERCEEVVKEEGVQAAS